MSQLLLAIIWLVVICDNLKLKNGDGNQVVKDGITFLRGLVKPLRNESYDDICKKVNKEIKTLGKGATFANFKDIDKKLGLPSGTAFEIAGFEDIFESKVSNNE